MTELGFQVRTIDERPNADLKGDDADFADRLQA